MRVSACKMDLHLHLSGEKKRICERLQNTKVEKKGIQILWKNGFFKT